MIDFKSAVDEITLRATAWGLVARGRPRQTLLIVGAVAATLAFWYMRDPTPSKPTIPALAAATAEREWRDALPLVLPKAKPRDIERTGKAMGLPESTLIRMGEAVSKGELNLRILGIETMSTPDLEATIEVTAGLMRATVLLDAVYVAPAATQPGLKQRLEDKVTKLIDGNNLKGRRVLVPADASVEIKVTSLGRNPYVRLAVNGVPTPILSINETLMVVEE